jgi:hypothetical protein
MEREQINGRQQSCAVRELAAARECLHDGPGGTQRKIIMNREEQIDNFELKYAEDIFSEEIINEELEAVFNEDIYKSEVKTDGPGRHYLLGTDIYGNKFPDHQGT